MQVNVESHARQLDGIEEVREVHDRQDKGGQYVSISGSIKGFDNMDGHGFRGL